MNNMEMDIQEMEYEYCKCIEHFNNAIKAKAKRSQLNRHFEFAEFNITDVIGSCP